MKIPSVSTFVPVEADADAEPPPYAPPYDPAFDVKLPSKGHKDGPVASPFAVLGEPPIARLLDVAPQDAGIIVIGGVEASGIGAPLDAPALNPQPLAPRDTPADIDEPSVAASARHRRWSR